MLLVIRSSTGVKRAGTFDGTVVIFSIISIKVSIVFFLLTNSVLKIETYLGEFLKSDL